MDPVSRTLSALPSVAYPSLPPTFQQKRPELAGFGVEFKSLGGSGEIKADRSKRRVELWIAGYGTVDLGGDLILSGSAARTIAEDFPRNLVKLYWNHQEPLGPCEVLEEHKEGLLMVGRVTDDPAFDRWLAQIEDGTAAHGSLGYSVRDFERVSPAECRRKYGVDPGAHPMVRVIKDMRVWEGSAVIWPMNELVQVVAVKNQSGGNLMERKDLWDLAAALECMARLRTLTTAEWAKLNPEEVAIAQNLVEQMDETKAAIGRGMAARETKGDAPIEASSDPVQPDEFKTLLDAVTHRRRAIETFTDTQ